MRPDPCQQGLNVAMMPTASRLYPTDMQPNQGSENVIPSGGGWGGFLQGKGPPFLASRISLGPRLRRLAEKTLHLRLDYLSRALLQVI